MSVPKTMKAVVCTGLPNAEIKEVPVPTPAEGEVLVKVHYASANPTDWKHKAWLSPEGSLLGCDLSGTIAKTSPKYPHLKEGTKVVAFVHGGKFDDRGSFAEYAKVRGDFAIVLPEDAEEKGYGKQGGLEGGSSLGIPFCTAAMCLFHDQGEEYPPAKKSNGEWFFVQGGASAVGMYAVQLAKLIGYKVAATCSPHSFDLVKGLGADLVVDYHNPAEAVKQIKEASNGKVVGSLECIGGKENTQLAFDTFGEAGGKLTVLLGVPEGLERAEKIKSNSILLYVVGGYAFEFLPKTTVPADKKAEEWFHNFVPIIPKFVSEYGIKPNPTSVRSGIESVLPGLKELEDGKVSGTKLVFQIA